MTHPLRTYVKRILAARLSAINRLPYKPTRIGSMGWFAETGITTLTVDVELRDGKLSLVPTRPRGAPGVPKTVERRKIENFRPVHLPQEVAVYADEVLGMRAFGSSTEEETLASWLNQKMAVATGDLDVTHEFHRIGAVKGQVLDADGTTVLYDLFTKFGLTQQTHAMALGTGTTKVRQKVTEVKRKMEDKLGGVMMSHVHMLCGSAFHDALVNNDNVLEMLKQDKSETNRSDVRDRFDYGGAVWEEYRGSVGGTQFIAANEAYAIPVGVPNLFRTYYAPANYEETVGTMGRPRYIKGEAMPFGKGTMYEVQSNPLHMCERPDAIIKLTL